MKKKVCSGEKNAGIDRTTKETKHARSALIVAVLTSFITTFMGSALNLSIPSLSTELGAGGQTAGWVITIYLLTCAALAVPLGYLADRGSRRAMLRIGIAVFGGASAAACFACGIWMLLLIRGLQGVGASMIFSTNLPILIEAFDEARRGRVLGYAACANYLGLSAGPVLGGILNTQFGWRSVFFCTATVSALSLSAATFGIGREKRNDLMQRKSETGQAYGKSGHDIAGSLLFAAAIISFMYGLSGIGHRTSAIPLLLAGAGAFILFLRNEKKREDAVLSLRLFQNNPSFLCSNLAAMISYGANFSVTYLLALYLQIVQDYTAQTAGFFMLCQTAVMALLAPWMGKLSDKHSPQLLSAAGMAISAGSLGSFFFLTPDSALWPVLLGLTLCGIGFSFFSTPNTKAVMSAVKETDYGTASSVLATMRSMGNTGCMALITAAFGIYLGNTAFADTDPQLFLKAMRTVFLADVIFCILGIFMAKGRKM